MSSLEFGKSFNTQLQNVDDKYNLEVQNVDKEH